EPMGFHLDAGFRDLESDKHVQGVARFPGPGKPYLYVARNGNPWPAGSDEPGQIGVVRFGSRGGDGERLRSNRMNPERHTFDRGAPWPVSGLSGTAPHWEDRVTYTLELDGNDNPGYSHPGGMTIVDGLLVVGVDERFNGEGTPAMVLFFDLSNPAKPVLVGQLPISEGTAHAVAVARTEAEEWLLLVLAGSDDTEVDVYLGRGNTLLAAVPNFTHVDTWDPGRDGLGLGDHEWPYDYAAFQNLDVVRQCDGTQFLVGTHNTASAGWGSDYVKVFGLEWDGAELHLMAEANKHLYCKPDRPSNFPYFGAERQCNLVAGAGTYVSPRGELIVYSTEHDNDGPVGSVKMMEFRHEEVFAPLTASREALAVLDGPSQAASGSTAVFYAFSSVAPAARPWFELYADEDFGAGSIVYDWPDRGQESWDQLDLHDFFGEDATSIRWEAPPGCRVELFSRNGFDGSRLILDGTGSVASIADLRTVGFHDRAHSARMTGDCNRATFRWKIDGMVDPSAVSGVLLVQTGFLGVGNHTIELRVCFDTFCDETTRVLQVTP
ncbi:MAG: hypothetical protein V3T72_17190, partial [Thermoanaerobaculia bacterium]